MHNYDLLWILLAVHLFCCLVYTVLIFLRRTYLRKEHIIMLFLVPLFGIVTALVIDFLHLFGKPGQQVADFEAVKLENDIYWKTLKQTHDNPNVVPLEEAILIDDVKIRRKVMLETLEEDPIKYMDILMVARDNDDTETVHYATTQISKEQRYFQLQMQKFAVAFEQTPNDLKLVNAYITLFDQYLQSGLLEKDLLKRQRILYSQLLDKKLELVPNDQNTLIQKLRNYIDLEQFTNAQEVSETIINRWPHDEDSWIEALRVCVESRDDKMLKKLETDIQNAFVDWTKQGKEQINYWLTV